MRRKEGETGETPESPKRAPSVESSARRFAADSALRQRHEK